MLQGKSINDDGDDADESSLSCGDKLKRAAAGKAVHFLEGALPPVTGTFRRVYTAADMALSYSTLAITSVLNIYTAIALWSLPVNPSALLLGFVPQVHLYAFFILCVEAVRLLSAVSAMPFQVRSALGQRFRVDCDIQTNGHVVISFFAQICVVLTYGVYLLLKSVRKFVFAPSPC